MEIDKKTVDALTSFGLTEYEAKVYLGLVMKGVQKASALADISDIPRPHVYSVIKLLQEKGLIITIPEKVAKYQAVPLETVLSKLLDERMASVRSLEAIGKDLADMIKDKGSGARDDESEKVRLYTGRWAIIDLIHKMMERALRTCLIITNDRSFVLTSAAYEQDLAGMGKRGITTRFLIPIEKDTFAMVERLSKKALIRHLDSMDHLDIGTVGVGESSFLRVVVIDEAEVLFIKASPDGTDESAIWTSQRELAKMIGLMFNHMWWNAPDTDAKRAEIETGRKPEHLTPIYGDAEVENAMRMIIANSRSHISCVITQDQLVYNLNTLAAELRTQAARDVKIRVLVSLKGGNLNRGHTLSSGQDGVTGAIDVLKAFGADVRHPLEESILRMFMNEDEVIFNLLGESAMSSRGGNIGVYTNHQDTIARISEHFDRLWEHSMDAGERLAEINQYIGKEVLKDGEEGIKKYFDRLSGLHLGHFAIKSNDPEKKVITIVCTDSPEDRQAMKENARSDICESVRNAFKSFGEYVYEGTRMSCTEVKCVSRGDKQCEFRLYPAERDRKAVSSDLVKFFDSIRAERGKSGVK